MGLIRTKVRISSRNIIQTKNNRLITLWDMEITVCVCVCERERERERERMCAFMRVVGCKREVLNNSND